jgi:hypothetical protein
MSKSSVAHYFQLSPGLMISHKYGIPLSKGLAAFHSKYSSGQKDAHTQLN